MEEMEAEGGIMTASLVELENSTLEEYETWLTGNDLLIRTEYL